MYIGIGTVVVIVIIVLVILMLRRRLCGSLKLLGNAWVLPCVVVLGVVPGSGVMHGCGVPLRYGSLRLL